MSFKLLRTFSDEELLNTLRDKAHLSPVVSELCRRLESYIDIAHQHKLLDHNGYYLETVSSDAVAEKTVDAQCPVCLAKIEVAVHVDNQIAVTDDLSQMKTF